MNLLLDTHTFLWWIDDPNLLSKEAKKAIRDAKNVVFISSVVIWEIIIKKSLGKLAIPNNLESMISENNFVDLPVKASHAFSLEDLPDHHTDPFDRMLISQALSEGLTIVTRDTMMQKYAVPFIVA